MSNVINFYGRSMPYFEFSNFYRAPIMVDGSSWKTSEHYYQAMKFYGHSEHVKAVKEAKTPMMAANIGRDKNRPMCSSWNDIRDDIMYKALYAKFTQHENLKELLLGTDDALIVEHTTNDNYWGDGGDGSGKNMLGTLLMKLRDALREEDKVNNYAQRVLDRAVEVFGDELRAEEWMEKQNSTLGSNPRVLCSTIDGFNTVMIHLHHIELFSE